MKNLLLTLGLLLSTLLNTPLSRTHAQAWTDAYRLGGAGEDDISALITDASGTQYLTGRFEQTISFGSTTLTSAGMHDIYLAARSATGQWLWAVQAGGSGDDSASELNFGPGGDIWLASGFFSDSATYGPDNFTNLRGYGVAISRLSTAGQWRWTTVAISPAVAFINGFSIDNNGSVTAAGVFGFGAAPGQDSAITFGPSRLIPAGSFDIFVAHLSPTGQWTGAVRAGSTGFDQCYSTVGSANGSLTLTGQFGHLPIGSSPITFGSTVLTPTGEGDGFVARISTTDQWEWAVPFSGPNTEFGFGLAVDAADNIYVAGGSNGPATFGTTTLAMTGTIDGFVAKLNSARQWEWAKAISGRGADWAFGVAVETGGDVFVTGTYANDVSFGSSTLTTNGSNDAFVGLISAAGQWRGAIAAGCSINAIGYRFGRDAAGQALVMGTFVDAATFGSHPITGAGTDDAFVATLDRTLLGIRATAAENEAPGAFSLAPNPATGATRMSWPAPATRTAAAIELLDACGRQIGRWTPAVGATTLLLPINGLPSGLYLVRQGGAAQRLVVE